MTAEDFEPYFEGLRSAPASAVESVGANLFDFEAHQKNGFNSIIKVIPNKTLYRNAQISTKNLWRLYDNANVLIGDFETFGFTASNPLVLPSNASYIQTTDGDQSILMELYIGYNSDITYRPYTKRAIEIPEAVRPAHGIPNGAYDFIEWCEDGARKSHKRVEKVVFNGSEKWRFEAVYHCMVCPIEIVGTKGTQLLTNSDIYCGYATNDGNELQFGSSTYPIENYGYSSLDEWKAHLATNPIEVVYVIATPVITDISDILTADNYIGVESGGTVTMANEHRYDVPSSITYQIKEVSE